ncbi:MAG TPA: type II toxin-antitoxin system VapC family toxin [Thermoanaerobaculia bacterium]|nr:type II toxin-antitoxin system VapC family toxin [Thermoanaerobaculia bacterium]
MANLFVDTNVFLRFLTDDDPAKARRAERLFEKAVAGEVMLETSLLVIAEIVWTLESFYRLAKGDIAEKVSKILNTPNLSCETSLTILAALDLYVDANVDFIDAYHGVLYRRADAPQIVTFDKKHFGRMDWLEVVEP